MNCACEFSPWLEKMLSGAPGASLIVFTLVLFYLGQRALRREHFGKLSLGKAVLFNLPAVTMHIGAVACIITVLYIYIRS